MAKVTIAGKAVVITSDLKFDDLENVKKYQPKALVLMGGEDGKEAVFAASIVPGSTGKVGKFGVEFGEKSVDGFATMTLVAPSGVEDMKEYVADT